MGVPCYFRELINKYRHILTQKLDIRVNALYIDANCLFHPCCFKVLDEHVDLCGTRLFDEMTKYILDYIELLISHVNPQTLVYIAVDGVAPLAKISQQRKRRFGYANDYKTIIYKKYNVPINDSWSNIVITPGTDFMYKLHQKITAYCKSMKNRKFSIIYDSYLTPGEGEHKILQHIKSNINTHKKRCNVIYGLDADLIFLAMASHVNNIFLLRETSAITYNAPEKLMTFVNIDIAKNCIASDLKYALGGNIGDDNKFVDDYIFVCYLLGNDFLPHIPSLEIDAMGLNIIISAYCSVFFRNQQHLINSDKSGVTINKSILVELLQTIATGETNFFVNDLPELLEKHQHKRCTDSAPHKKDIWAIENLKNIDTLACDPVKLGSGSQVEWKSRYYAHYFNTNKYMPKSIADICHNYVEGLYWVAKYYFEECPSWQWQYVYSHAPFISDIANYLKFQKTDMFVIPYCPPLDMIVQLVSIVPPLFHNILPTELQFICTSENSPVIDMFPTSYHIDTLNKTKLYKCIPIIPCLDAKRIKKVVEQTNFDTSLLQYTPILPITFILSK